MGMALVPGDFQRFAIQQQLPLAAVLPPQPSGAAILSEVQILSFSSSCAFSLRLV